MFSRHPALPRILPFAAYMLVVGGMELASCMGLAALAPATASLLYPLKAGLLFAALVVSVPYCAELRFRDLLEGRHLLLSLAAGLMVFALWINLDQPWAMLGSPVPFTPEAAPEGVPRTALLVCRFLGAALLIPLAEELFWRSWLIRALEYKNFLAVEPGRFGPFAFTATAVLFALEHHLVVAGLLAGIIYTLVLWRTRSVMLCVVAHAVTNAALGGWVLRTGQWHFW